MNSKENDCSKKNIYNTYFNLLRSEFGTWEGGGTSITDNFYTREMIVN